MLCVHIIRYFRYLVMLDYLLYVGLRAFIWNHLSGYLGFLVCGKNLCRRIYIHDMKTIISPVVVVSYLFTLHHFFS